MDALTAVPIISSTEQQEGIVPAAVETLTSVVPAIIEEDDEI